MPNVQKDFLYNDDFIAYVAQVGTPAPTMSAVMGGTVVVDESSDGRTPDPVGSTTWRQLGRKAARQYGESGITFDPGISQNDIMMLGSTAVQDVRVTASAKTLVVRLADFQAHTFAAVWNFDMATFGASGTGRVAEVDMMLPAYRNEAALAIVGQQNLWRGAVGGRADRMVLWMPRVSVKNIGSFDLTKGDAAEIEITFGAMEYEVSSGSYTDMRIYQQITN